MKNPLKIVAAAAGLLLFAGTTGLAPAQALKSSAALPAGAGDFVPTIDLSSDLASLVNVVSSPCTVSESNITPMPVGATLTLPPSDLGQFLTALTAIKAKADSRVALLCSPELKMGGEERTISGTVTNAALSLSGSFTLKCVFEEGLSAKANLSFGLGVKGLMQLEVLSASKDMPMTCAMAMSFGGGTTVSGTIDGLAQIGTTVSQSCSGSTLESCVPLSVDAKVSVTSATGKFAGLVGMGTYSFTPSFTVPSLNSNLGLLSGQLKASSVRASRAVVRESNTSGSMQINFAAGKAKTEILHPSVSATGSSTFGKGLRYGAVSAPKERCVFTAVKGKKKFSFPALTAASNGATASKNVTATQSKAMAKALGLKVNAAFSLQAKCGKTTTTQSVTYTG